MVNLQIQVLPEFTISKKIKPLPEQMLGNIIDKL